MSDFARGATEGTRIVIRYRLHNEENGATDAVGFVSAKNDSHIVLATVRGLTTIAFDDVILAKEVPPPPHQPAR